jgi:hypothetical protein
MKNVFKLMIYSILVVSLCVFITVFYKNHPEVQLAFLIPGVLIFVYSKIRDDVYVSLPVRLRMARGK